MSRRCWQLLCSPQLLHTVSVSLCGGNERQLVRLRSLARFLLQRAAGHVRCLYLFSNFSHADVGQALEHGALVAAAVAACSGLEELDLATIPAAVLSSWLLPLGASLRRLRTGDFTSTTVAGSLEFLTALQDLQLGLSSHYVEFTDDARLPPSITRLAVGNGDGLDSMPPQVRVQVLGFIEAVLCWPSGRCCCRRAAATSAAAAAAAAASMAAAAVAARVGLITLPPTPPPPGAPCPPQISTLHNLRHLRLQHPYSDVGSYGALARLPLTRLELGVCCAVPSCLSALATLEALAVDGSQYSDFDDQTVALRLCDALPRLTRLTYLALDLETPSPLAQLTALPNLRSLYWGPSLRTGAILLPPGVWLSGLQALGAPLPLLACSLPVLCGAQQLEEVSVYGARRNVVQLLQLLRWAPRHRSLRRLLLGCNQLDAEAWQAVAAAASQNPSLRMLPGTVNPLAEL